MSDSEEEVQEKQFKVVIVGDGSAGKTSISQKFAKDAFVKEYNQTLGIDFYLKRIQLTDSYHVTLVLNDVGGQTIGGAMLDKYIYGADIVLLVYDITNLQSFENLEDWYQAVVKHCAGRKPLFALVGNKNDLESLRAVTRDRHAQFAKSREMLSFFVSAKTGESIEKLFCEVTAHQMKIVLPKNTYNNDGAIRVPRPAPRIETEPEISKPVSQSRTSICTIQ